MSIFLLDPIVFLLPPEDASQGEVVTWIENLQLWLQATKNAPEQWYHCASLVFESLGYSSFPTVQVLRRWQRLYHLDIDIHEITMTFTFFLSLESYSLQQVIEHECLAIGWIIETTNRSITLDPEQIASRWPDGLREKMLHLLAYCCVNKEQHLPVASSLQIATSALEVPGEYLYVSTEGTILTENEGLLRACSSTSFPLLFIPEDIELLSVIQLWQQGEKAIRRMIDLECKQQWPQCSAVLPYTFGPQFLLSVRQQGLETNESILSKIIRLAAATIAGTSQHLNCGLHPLHESDSVSSPQRKRMSDGATAWRLKLTSRGVGWRLHYWHIPSAQGGKIEFANVLKKHDLETIP